jgi:hypothetical protein
VEGEEGLRGSAQAAPDRSSKAQTRHVRHGFLSYVDAGLFARTRTDDDVTSSSCAPPLCAPAGVGQGHCGFRHHRSRVAAAAACGTSFIGGTTGTRKLAAAGRHGGITHTAHIAASKCGARVHHHRCRTRGYDRSVGLRCCTPVLPRPVTHLSSLIFVSMCLHSYPFAYFHQMDR